MNRSRSRADGIFYEQELMIMSLAHSRVVDRSLVFAFTPARMDCCRKSYFQFNFSEICWYLLVCCTRGAGALTRALLGYALAANYCTVLYFFFFGRSHPKQKQQNNDKETSSIFTKLAEAIAFFTIPTQTTCNSPSIHSSTPIHKRNKDMKGEYP
jgi:hypothetical protein